MAIDLLLLKAIGNYSHYCGTKHYHRNPARRCHAGDSYRNEFKIY